MLVLAAPALDRTNWSPMMPETDAPPANPSFGHQFLVWAMRVWADRGMPPTQRDALLREGFARYGAPRGFASFVSLMEALAIPSDAACPRCAATAVMH